MQKLIIGIILIVGVILSILLWRTDRPLAAAPVIYFSPHQDDETISMGASIANHVVAGRTVYVVLITDGSASSARTKLCDIKHVCLTKAQFSAARTREFVAALGQLGVPASRIRYENVADGTLTSTQAMSIVKKYQGLFPGAAFKSMSWLDMLSDHYRFGYALNHQCVYGYIADCRFYQSPLYQIGSSIATYPVVTPRWGKEVNIRVRNAIYEYKRWDPVHGRYAIGYMSTKTQFDYAYAHYDSKYHLDNAHWLTNTDRLTAARWITAHQ